MRRFNVFTPAFDYDDDRPAGCRVGMARVGPAIGSRRVSATVYELPPGESMIMRRERAVGYWDRES